MIGFPQMNTFHPSYNCTWHFWDSACISEDFLSRLKAWNFSFIIRPWHDQYIWWKPDIVSTWCAMSHRIYVGQGACWGGSMPALIGETQVLSERGEWGRRGAAGGGWGGGQRWRRVGQASASCWWSAEPVLCWRRIVCRSTIVQTFDLSVTRSS